MKTEKEKEGSDKKEQTWKEMKKKETQYRSFLWLLLLIYGVVVNARTHTRSRELSMSW
jgi:hypothetical protein